MKTITNGRNIIFSCLAIALASIVACDAVKETSKKVEQKVEKEIKEVSDSNQGTASEEQRQFFYAWMADCINDNYEDDASDQSVLLDSAVVRIKGALKHPTLVGAFGNSELVWGPQLLVEKDLNGDYSSGNLMYCVKRDFGAGVPEYVVGIAGTDMISSFDWLQEDLNVTSAVSSPLGEGLISKGASIGLANLKSMKSTGDMGGDAIEDSIGLIDYLQQMVGRSRNIVSVTGHSLGGALTQVFSAELRTNLPSETHVKAWVYAGPTAGDKDFANALVKSVEYHAYNNRYGVIPRAWQEDSLNTLCTLYEGRSLCGQPIKSNSSLNGVVKYLKAIGGNYDYTIPGTPELFDGNIGDFGYCDKVEALVSAIYHNGSWNEIYKYLNELKQHCNPGGDDISEEDIRVFIYYFALLGEEHTTAYANYFFPNPVVRGTVAKYTKGDGGYFSSTKNMFEGKDILEKFLTRAAGFVKSQPAGNCECS